VVKKRRATTQDIADLAGVSKATVSYALNGTGSVSKEVTERIVNYAIKLGYRANKLAAATRTGKTNTVGLVVPDLSNPYFPELAQAVHKAAHERGYAVFLVDSNQSISMEFEGVERLTDYRVDGILWAPMRDESVSMLDVSVPTVLMDRNIDGFSSVCADTFRGGQMQAEYVQKMGHRKIGIVSGPTWSPHAMLRSRGALSSIQSGTSIEWEIQKEYGVDLSSTDIKTIINSDVSCIIAGNDLIAIDVLQAYRNSRIETAVGVSIIGFDDIAWAGLVSPSLTTIKPPKRDVGRQALELLCDLMVDPGRSNEHQVLNVELIERESVIDISC